MAVVIDEVTPALKKLDKELRQIDKRIVKVAGQVKVDMVNRTRKGIDANGRPFKSYSAGYIKVKGESGRPTSPVNLTWHGHMLNAEQVKRITGGAEIYFNQSGELNKANWNQYGKKPREFFGLDNNNIKYIEDQLGKGIEVAIR